MPRLREGYSPPPVEKVKKPPPTPRGPKLEGTWSADDLRRAFVAGAKWWEFVSRAATMWPSDVRGAEEEAEKRYREGSLSSVKGPCRKRGRALSSTPQI